MESLTSRPPQGSAQAGKRFPQMWKKTQSTGYHSLAKKKPAGPAPLAESTFPALPSNPFPPLYRLIYPPCFILVLFCSFIPMADTIRNNSYPDKDNGKVRNFSVSANAGTGKLPPQALDMEEAVLGALLLEKDALHRVMDIIQPHMFYKDANSFIFEAILNLFQNSEPVDILTVKNTLRQNGKLDLVGGAFYLTELTSRVASAANIEYHARVIAEKFILRQLISISDGVIKDAYDETTDVFDLLDRTEQSLFEVSESNLRRNYMGMSELMVKTLERLEEMRGKDGSIVGIPSGIADLDKMTAGWQKSDLVIIAARPAMGKTAWALTLARNASMRFGEGVALFFAGNGGGATGATPYLRRGRTRRPKGAHRPTGRVRMEATHHPGRLAP